MSAPAVHLLLVPRSLSLLARPRPPNALARPRALSETASDAEEASRSLRRDSPEFFFIGLQNAFLRSMLATTSCLGFYAAAGEHAVMPRRFGTLVPMRLSSVHCSAAVSIAVCTGSSCESRCSFNSVRVFEDLAGEGCLEVTEIQCMNMCKRGPAVRLVADEAVTTVSERMSEVEVKRTAFQNVASMARVEAIYGVAEAIADGSLKDSYGEFAVEQHGPLPPSAMSS